MHPVLLGVYRAQGIVLVVVLEYCLKTPAARAILEAVAKYMEAHRAGIHWLAFCDADLPHMGLDPEASAKWRAEFLDAQDLRNAIYYRQFSVRATSMVSEVFEISRESHRRGIEPRKIVIFCDKWQVWPLKIMWQSAFPGIPDVRIEFRKIDCEWGGGHYVVPYMKSKWRWILHNIWDFIVLTVFGAAWLDISS